MPLPKKATTKDIKENIARAKSYIQRNDYLRTLKCLALALQDLLRSQVFGREKFEIAALLDEALSDLNRMKMIKRLIPDGIRYERGKEKLLHQKFVRLHGTLEAAIKKAKLEQTRKSLMQLDELLIAGQQHLEKGEQLEGRKLFRKASEHFGHVEGINSDIGNRLLMAGLAQEAMDYLQKAVEVDPKDRRAYPLIVRAWELLGELDKAEDVVNDTMRRFGANESLHLKLAQIAMAKRDWSKAHDAAQAVLNINPLHPEANKIVKKVEPRIFAGGGSRRPTAAKGKAPGGAKKAPGKAIKLDM